MEQDIRGFVPRRRLISFLQWFDECVGREDAASCLRRELTEELREARVDSLLAVPYIEQFRFVRRVTEGPSLAAGHSYTQYRIIDVYDTVRSEAVSVFVADLIRSAETHENLMIASSREIIAGSSADGRLIGHHAGYLLGRSRIGPDEPMFAESEGQTRRGAAVRDSDQETP